MRPTTIALGACLVAAFGAAVAFHMLPADSPGQLGGATEARGPRNQRTEQPFVPPEAIEESIQRMLAVELPTELPMIRAEGTDDWGYPLRSPDRAKLAALARARRFEQLDQHLRRLQQAFEDDPTKEYWPSIALDSFGAADLEEPLDEWVRRGPDGWPARAARGVHRVLRGYDVRGTATAAGTPAANMAQMGELMRGAREDLEAALILKPWLLAAHENLVSVGMAIDPALARRHQLEGLELCPTCESVRLQHFKGLAPKWYGESGEQAELIDRALARRDDNARLGVFAGYLDWQRCAEERFDQDHERAMEACNEAIRKGGRHWEFLLERAVVRNRADQVRLALADLEAARPLRPTQTQLLQELEWSLFTLGRLEEAIDVFEELVRIDPDNPELRRRWDSRSHAVAMLAVQRREAGDRTEAERLFDRAERLAPGVYPLMRRRFEGLAPEAVVAICQERLDARPESLAAHRCMDLALTLGGSWDDIIAMWDRYLARHPDEGPAYFERSGAKHHAGQAAGALADLQLACEHGSVPACRRAGQ